MTNYVNIIKLLSDIDYGKIHSVTIVDPDHEDYYISTSHGDWKWLTLDPGLTHRKQVKTYIENPDSYDTLTVDNVKNHLAIAGFMINRDPEKKTWMDIEYKEINDVGKGQIAPSASCINIMGIFGDISDNLVRSICIAWYNPYMEQWMVFDKEQTCWLYRKADIIDAADGEWCPNPDKSDFKKISQTDVRNVLIDAVKAHNQHPECVAINIDYFVR